MLVALLALMPWTPALAQESRQIEVVEVKGIIDGSVERAIVSTIEEAEREHAELVVLQIDSKGVVGDGRTERLIGVLGNAGVPVAAWIGPPGAETRNGATVLVRNAHISAISPLSREGEVETLDLHGRGIDLSDDVGPGRPRLRAASVAELLEDIDGEEVDVNGKTLRLRTEPTDVMIRFHKLDLVGRMLHAAAQPSITYLLLLLGLVGIVFELFHPSTGPAGIAGLAGLGLAVYGIVTLGGSWLGFALIVVGVVGFALDLRFQSLGPPTIVGFAALVAGSILLFNGPWLRVSPWILGFGIAGMVAFLLGAMTRVLRDLRAVARGELEVRDAHPHPNGDHA
jgi:membrane-bound serine protease (ClpP class)